MPNPQTRYNVAAARDRILWESGRQSVDEFVVHNVTVHLEMMADDCYWLGITRGDEMLMVNIVRPSRRGVPLRCHVEDDGATPWRWGRDEEHPA